MIHLSNKNSQYVRINHRDFRFYAKRIYENLQVAYIMPFDLCKSEFQCSSILWDLYEWGLQCGAILCKAIFGVMRVSNVSKLLRLQNRIKQHQTMFYVI